MTPRSRYGYPPNPPPPSPPLPGSRHLPRFGHAPAQVQAIDPQPYDPDEPIRRRGALAFGYGNAVRFRRQPIRNAASRDLLAITLLILSVSLFTLSFIF